MTRSTESCVESGPKRVCQERNVRCALVVRSGRRVARPRSGRGHAQRTSSMIDTHELNADLRTCAHLAPLRRRLKEPIEGARCGMRFDRFCDRRGRGDRGRL